MALVPAYVPLTTSRAFIPLFTAADFVLHCGRLPGQGHGFFYASTDDEIQAGLQILLEGVPLCRWLSFHLWAGAVTSEQLTAMSTFATQGLVDEALPLILSLPAQGYLPHPFEPSGHTRAKTYASYLGISTVAGSFLLVDLHYFRAFPPALRDLFQDFNTSKVFLNFRRDMDILHWRFPDLETLVYQSVLSLADMHTSFLNALFGNRTNPQLWTSPTALADSCLPPDFLSCAVNHLGSFYLHQDEPLARCQPLQEVDQPKEVIWACQSESQWVMDLFLCTFLHPSEATPTNPAADTTIQPLVQLMTAAIQAQPHLTIGGQSLYGPWRVDTQIARPEWCLAFLQTPDSWRKQTYKSLFRYLMRNFYTQVNQVALGQLPLLCQTKGQTQFHTFSDLLTKVVPRLTLYLPIKEQDTSHDAFYQYFLMGMSPDVSELLAPISENLYDQDDEVLAYVTLENRHRQRYEQQWERLNTHQDYHYQGELSQPQRSGSLVQYYQDAYLRAFPPPVLCPPFRNNSWCPKTLLLPRAHLRP